MITKKIKKNKGFVLLYVVIISSIILAITLSIASISLREIKFSTSARDTNNAFFAADTGVECVLFNDKSTGNSFIETGGLGTVQCLGNVIALNGNYPFWDFVISSLGSTEQGCAKITVDKSILPTTIVISKGYNIGDALCNSSNLNQVERQLELNY